MTSLVGKTALVTGGSRGIGRAVVTRLAAAGARVVDTYRSNPGVDLDLPGVTAIRADQGEPGAVGTAFAPVRDTGLDILVLNAGIVDRQPLAEVTAADVDRVMAINAKFPLLA